MIRILTALLLVLSLPILAQDMDPPLRATAVSKPPAMQNVHRNITPPISAVSASAHGPCLRPEQFGADPSKTDDSNSTAIQAMYTAAGTQNKCVFFPNTGSYAGWYFSNINLNAANNITTYCESLSNVAANGTKLIPSSLSATLFNVTAVSGIWFINCSFISQSQQTAGSFVRFTNVNSSGLMNFYSLGGYDDFYFYNSTAMYLSHGQSRDWAHNLITYTGTTANGTLEGGGDHYVDHLIADQDSPTATPNACVYEDQTAGGDNFTDNDLLHCHYGLWANPGSTLRTAALASGGSGYTNGTQTLTVTPAGITCLTPPQVSATVSGGVVTAITTILVYGACSAPLAGTLATSGGGGTGATVTVTGGGQFVTGPYVENTYFDSPDFISNLHGGNGIRITPHGGGIANEAEFENSWASTGSPSVFIQGDANSNCTGIQFSNFTTVNSYTNGWFIDYCDNVSVTNPNIAGNSSSSPGAYSGVLIGAHTNTFTSIGGLIGGPADNFPISQKFNIEMASGFAGALNVIGTNLRGCTINSGTPTINCVYYANLPGVGSSISGSPGFNPVGPIPLTYGTSPWTYQAGLSTETVNFVGGACSNITIQNGTSTPITWATSTDVSVPLAPLEKLTATCSSTPSVVSSRQ